jgi:CheY-like chemotaxis protein
MPLVAALVDDLMFLSRIREAARGAHLEVRSIRNVEAARAACAEGAGLIILDLDSPRLPALEVLRALAADPETARVPTVGFYGHVHPGHADAASVAGCEVVLARGAFVQRLPALLAEPPRRT